MSTGRFWGVVVVAALMALVNLWIVGIYLFDSSAGFGVFANFFLCLVNVPLGGLAMAFCDGKGIPFHRRNVAAIIFVATVLEAVIITIRSKPGGC